MSFISNVANMKLYIAHPHAYLRVGILVLGLVLLFGLSGNASAAGTWNLVGSAGFSGGFADRPSLHFDTGGTPYVAYRDGTQSDKATAKSFDGTNWVTVGSAGFSQGAAFGLSAAVYGTTPYVAYADMAHSGQATVKSFDGSNWVSLANQGFTSYDVSDANTSIAFDNTGVPYLAVSNFDLGDKASVLQFNGSDAWDPIGTEGFSADYVDYLSLAFFGTTPYLAYADGGNGDKLTVMKFNGTSWVAVGTPGFSADYAEYVSLAIDSSGTPYVGYMDGGNGDKATVMKFDGTNWVAVGSAGFSADYAPNLSLALYNDVPYVSFSDDGSGKATVMTFDNNAWVALGNAQFSSGVVADTSLAILNGVPYVAFQDGGSSGPATVMKLDAPLTMTVGNNGSSGPGSLRDRVTQVAPGGTVDFGNDYTIPLDNKLTLNKDVKIDGTGHTVTLNGQNTTRVFQVNVNTVALLDTVTISNGLGEADCGGTDTCGGGILNKGSLTVQNSTVQNSTADNGGGIRNPANATLDIKTAFIKGNTANKNGGGLDNQGTATVDRTSFTQNVANLGAAFHNALSLQLSLSTVSNNTATQDGGGIYNDNGGEVDVTESTLSDNTATNGNGGGVFNKLGGTVKVTDSTLDTNNAPQGEGGGISNNGVAKVARSTVLNSTAFMGGALMERGSNAGTSSVTNSTLQGNTATQDGGGIYADHNGTLEVTNTTLSDNTATSGSGGGILHTNTADPSSILNLRNTIISDSPAGGDCKSNGTVQGKNNLIKDTGANACGLTDGTNGNLIGRTPRLTPLQDNTGPTKTMRPDIDSPVIDAGDPTTCADTNSVNNLDQRGKARDDLQCDIGGVELTRADSLVVRRTLPLAAMATFGPTRAGLESSGSDPGEVTITFETTPVDRPGSSITPVWDISPRNDTGLDLTLKLCYSTTELNGQNESNLRFYRKPSGGSWTEMSGAPTFSGTSPNRCASRPGITGLSEWTLAPGATTAVDVGSVRGAVNTKGYAVIRWETLSEARVSGFNVYRRTARKDGADGGAWNQVNAKLIQVKDPGALTGAKYRFADKKVKQDKVYRYKVEVMYLDGHTGWTNVIRVKTP